MELFNYLTKFEEEFEKDINNQLFKEQIEIDILMSHTTCNIMDLHKELFFSNRKEISFYNPSENSLIIHVSKNNYKQFYFSYLTLDNNFDEVPTSPLVIKNHPEQKWIKLAIKSFGPKVRPFLIFYDDKEKLRLQELDRDVTKVVFDSKEKFCRLTFKVEGHGKAKIENINILNAK